MDFPRFAVASGEEASDPLVPHEGKIVRVDELAQSGHFERLESDLADVASLGIKVWRYGMPWRLTETRRGVYDWTLWDRALAACERVGLNPVIDLCHFGLPDHYRGFCEYEWVAGFIEYLDAFLARYPGPRWFTGVNEPHATALCAGLFGVWNDRRKSREDFATAFAHCVLANLEVLKRIRADREGWFVGAEVFTCAVSASPEEDEWAAQILAASRAGFDLQFGKPLDSRIADAFAKVGDRVMARIAELATVEHTIAGHDFYPVSVRSKTPRELTIAERVAIYERAAREWYLRYGVDFWVAETSNLGLPVAQQPQWFEALAGTLKRMRGDGLPARGICWYSRGDQYDWDSGLTQPVGRVTEVGLFDTQRRARPVTEAVRRLAFEMR